MSGRICFQKSAMEVVDDDRSFSSPALTISRMSSSSSAVGTDLDGRPAALPCCLNVAFSAVRLSNWMLFSRTATCLPERSSIALAIDGARDRSRRFRRRRSLVGMVKSTSLARSGVTGDAARRRCRLCPCNQRVDRGVARRRDEDHEDFVACVVFSLALMSRFELQPGLD